MYEIVKEEVEFVVINKHEGVDFHGHGLTSRLREDLGCDIFPVHRLDKPTSGLLIFAKTSKIAHEFATLFQSHLVKKTYIAISNKKPKKKQGLVKGDMEKARGGKWLLTRTSLKPAITRFESEYLKEGYRLYTLYPQTGKTHQLRVMMKSIGAPILGDDKYGGDKSDRVYLHALKIEFSLLGVDYTFSAPPQECEHFRIVRTHTPSTVSTSTSSSNPSVSSSSASMSARISASVRSCGGL